MGDCRRDENTGKYSKIHNARVRHTIRRCTGQAQFLLEDNDDNDGTSRVVYTVRERDWRGELQSFGHVRVTDAARDARIRQELAREMRRFIERSSMSALVEAIARPTKASARIEELRYVVPLDHHRETGDALVTWCLPRAMHVPYPSSCVCDLTESDRAAILSGSYLVRALEDFIETHGAATTILTEREARQYFYKHATTTSRSRRSKSRDSGVRRCHTRSTLYAEDDC